MIDQKHSFSFEDLEDILERQKFNIEILDEEYLILINFLNSIDYFNKKENKHCNFTIPNDIEFIQSIMDELNEYYSKSSLIPLFYYLETCSDNKIINDDLFLLYGILTRLINIDKAEENITENFNLSFEDELNNVFIKEFDVSLIDNDEYIIEGINNSINKMKRFKYVFDDDLTKSLTDDLVYLKNKLI